MNDKARGTVILPESAGKIVSMVEFKGSMYVATEFGVYRMGDSGDMERLSFVEVSPGDGSDE